MTALPKLSIGLPVYNGEAYLAAALGSLLAQRFDDFELIISDNASTDRTQEIARAFAAADPRVRYQCNPSNLGAAANYNLTVDQARAAYFKWAAHDDVCKPTYLSRCIDVLDAQPEVVLCHTQSAAIDARGRVVGSYDQEPQALQSRCSQRFAQMMLTPHYCIPVFGVMRRSVLQQTPRHGDWVGADRNLLAELALHGVIKLVPEPLFQRRDHAQSSISALPDERARAAWFRAGRSGRSYPTWRRGLEYYRSMRRAPISAWERRRCELVLLRWLGARHHAGRRNLSRMFGELWPAAGD